MGWFDRKKDDKANKPKSEEDEFAETLKNKVVQARVQDDESLLHKYLPGSEKHMPLLQAMMLTLEARLAYAKQVIALYEKQERKLFLVLKRGDKEVFISPESPQAAVEQTLTHLRVRDQFPVSEFTEYKAAEQNNEYFDQFDQMMKFLMKRLDRSQPMVDQVSRLIDAVNLDHIGVAVTEAVKDKDQAMMRGKLKDRVIKYLVAMNKM